MTTPAQGNTAVLGFAPEISEGIRDDAATYAFVKPVLPLNGRFGFAKAASGEVNQSGFAEKSVPGAITGAIDFGCRMSVPALFTFLRTFFRDITKSTLETGVYQYVCEIDRTLAERTLSAIFGLPPVDQMFQHGIKLGQVVAQVGNNTAINARITGQALHFSRLGAAIAGGGNTGTYTGLPILKGPLASPAAGNVFVEVTDDSPLTVRIKQAAGTSLPSMAGSTVVVQTYDADGNGKFVNALAHDGSELGIWGENKDPLGLCFPGDATAHALTAVGDYWYFPVDWDLPSPTFLAGQRMTSAHQENYYSTDGGSTWVDLNTLTSSITIGDPIAVDSGSGSRYPFAIDRNGQFVALLNFTRKLRDRTFRDIYETDDDLKFRTYFRGQLLAGGPNRESILFDWNRLELMTLTDPAQNDNAIIETVGLRGIAGDAGEAPVSVTFITDQNYSV